MRLPYFPLHTVLFPHLPLPLHIFEERYRAMARDLLASGSPWAGRFVVSMITDGSEVGAESPSVQSSRIGTVAEVRSAEELPDGRWVLLAVGVHRAEIVSVDRGGAYATVDVRLLEDETPEADDAGALLARCQEALDGYLATVKRFVAASASKERNSSEMRSVASTLDQVLKPIRLPADPAAASYAVAGVLQIELTRKQQLLELPDAATRLAAEIALLRREAELLADGALPPVTSGELHYNPN